MQNTQLMTVKQVAQTLSCGVSTIWRWVRAGDFPAPVRIGGATRWRAADIARITDRASE